MVALHRGDDLTTVIALLRQEGCLPAAAAERLSAAVPPSGERDTSVFLRELAEAEVCSTGRELLGAIADAPILPLYERDRLLVDTDADGCHDSVYFFEEATLLSADADADGCVDLLHEVEHVSAFASLPEDTRAHLLAGVAEVLQLLLPAGHRADEEPYSSLEERRLHAQSALEDLIDWVAEEPSVGEHAELFTRYLSHGRPFVDEWVGCDIPPTPPPPEEPPGVAEEPRRFYVYTTGDHAFKSLSVADREWKRGLYPAWHSAPAAAADVPDATSASTTSPTPAPPSGGTSTWHTVFNGFSWGADAVSDAPAAGALFGFGLGALTYEDGKIADESSKPWSSRVCWEITPQEWDTIAAHMNADIEDPPEYSLVNHNCMSWAANNAALIGRRLPPYTTMSIPDPGALENALQEIGNGGSYGGGTVSMNVGQ